MRGSRDRDGSSSTVTEQINGLETEFVDQSRNTLRMGIHRIDKIGWAVAEACPQQIFDVAAAQGFPVSEVRLWETPRCVATYTAEPTAT